MIDSQKIDDLREYLAPCFDIFAGLDIYFWIASGCIRDFYVGADPQDFDLFFPTRESMQIATKRILNVGAKKVCDLPEDRGAKFKLKDRVYDLACWDGSGDPSCIANTPGEMIKWFDYTVEMAALDVNGKFYSHPCFFEDCRNKKLARNSICDFYPRANSRRLMKYINRGYTIDTDNLLIWLEDQEATFEYRRQKNK
jgi:hypothetical protein